jgi:hypothetical protein
VTTTPCPTTTPCTTPGPTTVTTTPCPTTTPCTTKAASPCGTVAPAAKFALEQKADEKKDKSLFQRLADTPITTGVFGLLLASAAIGMIVRVGRSYRRANRVTFTGRSIVNDGANYDGIDGISDVEANQAFIE